MPVVGGQETVEVFHNLDIARELGVTDGVGHGVAKLRGWRRGAAEKAKARGRGCVRLSRAL